MDDLTFGRLREVNIQRCTRWQKPNAWSLSDWGVAMAGEAGEACNVLKKLNRVRDGMTGNSETPLQLQEQLAEELADVAIYLDLLAWQAGISLEAAVIKKFNKTSEKNEFPERL